MRVATETRSAELESYVLPGVTLTGSRSECVAQIDEVIRGLLFLRRHIAGDDAASRQSAARDQVDHRIGLVRL